MTQPAPPTSPASRFPDSDAFPTGPAVGEPVPDFTLRDQHGREVNFAEYRAGKRALLVFHRSAHW